MPRILLAVSCLFLLSIVAFGQENTGGPNAAANFMQMRKSPMMQSSMKMGMKAGLRSFWSGRGGSLMAIQLLQEPDVRTAWNVSDEQYQQIQDVQKNQAKLFQNPAMQELMKEMQTIAKPGDPSFMQNADEETKKKFENIQERMISLTLDSMTDAIDDILTPEQQRKVKEFQLAMLSEKPVLSPNSFEILDLTDAQKQQMEGIKKELEPEFEKNVEDFANGQMILSGKMFDELEKQGGDFDFRDQKAMGEKMAAIGKKLAAEDPEIKRITEEMQSKGKQFATQFKVKLFDVLTDEQWARLQELTDNPPEYIVALRKKMKELFDKTEQTGAWQPNADSWKPGEAIPEEYRQKRQLKGFPKSDP